MSNVKKQENLQSIFEHLRVENDEKEEEELKDTLPIPNNKTFILDNISDREANHLNKKELELDKPNPDTKNEATQVMIKQTKI